MSRCEWCLAEGGAGPVLCEACAELAGRVAEADMRGDREAVESVWTELEERHWRYCR
jgi:hypothetical protein